ncbi:hypothetical protein RhiirC2_800670 [Rhizophagus irregularis]|uniref:Uncharacterized protein n=1 Tax=Rhizophagus irregularis TaxID=588596 RepID=A0A2N1M3B4_9GLOM|nr:hypothetical protein RhiirC2_800670 [Rhizophagus irregularis]
MNILPLTNNHAMIIYIKSNNDIKKKYSIIINYNNKSIKDIITGKVIERKNGKFHTLNLLSYILVNSLNFLLINEKLSFMYILKYNEIKKSDPNLQY